MLVGINDIVRIEGKSEIIEIGGQVVESVSEIAMHKDTGIVFIKQSYKETGKLYCFTVGKLDHAGEITEKREYHEKTEKDFFDAVKYFEELIKKEQPEENQDSPPSMGKFYFFKSGESYVLLSGVTAGSLYIDDEDISKVFTPPQKKPFGRLDMTAVDKDKYELIRSKFALKYDAITSKNESDRQKIDLTDLAVYDMTPYSNDSQDQNGQSDSTPEEVNDNQLSPDQIEGEDLNDQKNKDQQKQERQDKKKQQQQKQESSENQGDEKDQSQDENQSDQSEGASDQKNDSSKQNKPGKSQSKSDQKDSKTDDTSKKDDSEPDKQSDNQPSEKAEQNENGEQLKESDEQTDEESDETVEGTGEDEGDSESEEENEKSKVKHTKGSGEVVEGEIPDHLAEIAGKASSQDFVSALSKMYNTNDLKDAFRRQRNLLMALDSMSENELKQNIYKKLSLPKDLPKTDFISLVESKTKNLFQ